MSIQPFKIKSEIKIDSSKADKELKTWKERHKKEKIKIDIDVGNFKKLEKSLKSLQKIANGNFKNGLGINKNDTSKLLGEYKDIANTIDKLQKQMNKGIGSNSIVRTNNEVEKLKRTYEQLANQIDKTNRSSFDSKRDNKNLVSMNKDLIKLESLTDKTMNKLNSLSFDHIDTTHIKEIERYLNKLKDLSNKDLKINLDINVGDAINQIKDLDRTLTNLGKVDKLAGDFQKIEHAIKDAFGDNTVSHLKNELKQLEGMATNLDGSFDKAFHSMSAGMKEVTNGINHMQNELHTSKNKFDKMLTFAIGNMAGDVLYDSVYGAVSAIGDLDAAITNVKKVANDTDLNSALKLDKFKNDATEVAKTVGMSISEVMEATGASIQAGLAKNIQDALKVSEQTMKLANVGEMSQEDASSTVNSIVNGFKLNPLKQVQVEMDGTVRKTNELELAMDMLNHVG